MADTPNGNGKGPDWRWIVGFCGVAFGAMLGLTGTLGFIVYTDVERQIREGAESRTILDARLSELIQRETTRNNAIERELGEVHSAIETREKDSTRNADDIRILSGRIQDLLEKVAQSRVDIAAVRAEVEKQP